MGKREHAYYDSLIGFVRDPRHANRVPEKFAHSVNERENTSVGFG